jgi:hypothetical protein
MRLAAGKLLAFPAIAGLGLTPASAAPVQPDVVRPIAGFEVTIMPPGSGGKLFGWVELTDSGGHDSGYIYFDDSDNSPPHLSFSKTYIVTHLPYNQIYPTIDLLRNVHHLQIRYSDATGNNPTVFIESYGAPSPAAAALHLNAEESQHVQAVRR